MSRRPFVLTAILFLLTLGPLGAQVPTPTPWPLLRAWKDVPWDGWFKDNALVTDKGGYVHFFLNAQDFRSNLEVKDKKERVAETALELARRLYPAAAKADLLKLDIVYVLERDSYGMPKWDSLKRVAHLEVSRSKVPATKDPKAAPLGPKALKLFDKVEIYP